MNKADWRCSSSQLHLDHFTLHEASGPSHDMTLRTVTHVPRPDGGFDSVPVVAAHIRFSSEMARGIVAALMQQFAMMEGRGEARD